MSEWLLSTEWLHKNLDNRHVVVVDIRLPEEYNEEHIPGAVFVPDFYDYFVDTGAEGIAQFQRELTNWIRLAGISAEDTVVCYENTTGMRCARGAWILAYAGARNVLVLDSGFNEWKARGYRTSHAKHTRAASSFEPSFDASILATRDETLQASRRSDTVILDCREREEFLGTDDHDCCPRRGRIPNSVWFYWRRALEAEDAHFKDVVVMRREFEEAGAMPDKEVIIYCHRGARAANTWMALKRLGYPNVKKYVGSWHEWSGRAELPVESGE